MARNWNRSEEKFMNRFYANTSNELLADAMGRSRSSITHKALRMGLVKRNRFDRFTTKAGRRVHGNRARASLR